MSQSSREPQSKRRLPQDGSSGIPAKVDVPRPDAPPADALPAATPPAQSKVAAAPAAVPPPTAVVSEARPGGPFVPTAAAAAAPVPAVAPAPAGDADFDEDDADEYEDDDDDDEPAVPLTLKDWLRRLSPVYATMTVVSIGSAGFLALAMTSHTTPVAVLMSAGVVTCLAFALDVVLCTSASYEAGRKELTGRAVLFALLGGVSAVICALSAAGTLIMVLVLNS